MTNLTPTQICSRLVELDILVPDMRGMSLDCYCVPGRTDDPIGTIRTSCISTSKAISTPLSDNRRD